MSDELLLDYPQAALRVTRQEIEFAGKRIALAEVDGVAYHHQKTRVSGIPMLDLMTFVVKGAGQKIQIVLSGSGKHKAEDEEAFAALISLSQHLIEPRLVQDRFERLAQGASVEIQGITVTQHGIWKKRPLPKRSSLEWQRFAGIEFLAGDVVVHAAKGNGNTKFWARVPTAKMNVVLLPPLVQAAYETWYTAAPRADGAELRLREPRSAQP
jgi:hypothetical protein